MEQATLRPMVFKQFATDARAPHMTKEGDEPGLRSVDFCLQTLNTNFKHCESDATCSILCCVEVLLLCARFVELSILLQNLFATIAATDRHFFLYLNRCRVCRRSARLLATSSDSNFGKDYVIGFLKMYSLLLWFTIYGNSSSK